MTGYVLDDTVIEAFAFSDSTVVAALFGMTERDIRFSVPAATLAHAQVSLSDDMISDINSMIHHLSALQLEPLATTSEVTDLARVLGTINEQTPSEDFAAAHAVVVARKFDWPIVTTSLTRWEPITRVLDIDVREMRDSPE